ncbi:DUF2480 family protein [Negadavirga shengliensis]|uniref:DUF2480 family protein n=1 Tax=Negadavirga shengliensis TaxID=1389218 RepID=A0ABV9SWN2_9BACT
MTEIVNRVANSPIVTIDLDKFYREGERVIFDLKPFLFQEMVLREKDYRQQLKELDWTYYKDKFVAVTCSADAIIPSWAYMLAMTYLKPVAAETILGDQVALEQYLVSKSLQKINPEDFLDKPVVIKGCSKFPVTGFVYGELMNLLMPFARSIMYGEPCSTVPIYKRAKPQRDQGEE